MNEIEESHIESKSPDYKGNAAINFFAGTPYIETIGKGGYPIFGEFYGRSLTTNGTTTGESAEALNLERKMNVDLLAITKNFYENKIQEINELHKAFYSLDKQDTKNAFDLYKYSRDNKDELSDKINCLQTKVDMMAAVRPYQDMLIESRIHDAEQRADFNLFKRTCKMIEGQLVLPDTAISGYPSIGRFTNN